MEKAKYRHKQLIELITKQQRELSKLKSLRTSNSLKKLNTYLEPGIRELVVWKDENEKVEKELKAIEVSLDNHKQSKNLLKDIINKPGSNIPTLNCSIRLPQDLTNIHNRKKQINNREQRNKIMIEKKVNKTVTPIHKKSSSLLEYIAPVKFKKYERIGIRKNKDIKMESRYSLGLMIKKTPTNASIA